MTNVRRVVNHLGEPVPVTPQLALCRCGFVAPSRGRMDEIIRAVRDCPSGALSLAFEGREAREMVDWGDRREPSIEVTRDGPYRITGGITLTGPGGQEVERNAGASREHCALCRCGHSQNKPFCSGMHWYVGFRDPVPAEGHEPTLAARRRGSPKSSAVRRPTARTEATDRSRPGRMPGWR